MYSEVEEGGNHVFRESAPLRTLHLSSVRVPCQGFACQERSF